jgi:hypothetical protein
MTKCKHYDYGFCYAPKDVSTTALPSGACAAPTFCPYLISQQSVQYETPMTENEEEIEKVKAQIKVLEKKLTFLEELSKTKSPAEEAYKNTYGFYPETYSDTWSAFQDGYNAAQEDYKVGEHQEPEENEWKNVALKFGKKLPAILPHNYDELSPKSWFRWAVFTYDAYIEQRDKESGYTPKSQERGERVHKEMEELVNKIYDGYGVVEYQPTPQTPEEIEQSLREAFREAQKTEKWKETQKLIDEKENDKIFKNSLDLIKEWGEKNKPPTLTDIIWNWWEDVFTSLSDLDADASIQDLVNRIDKQFIPPYHNTNGYEWEKCLKVMRDKLR